MLTEISNLSLDVFLSATGFLRGRSEWRGRESNFFCCCLLLLLFCFVFVFLWLLHRSAEAIK